MWFAGSVTPAAQIAGRIGLGLQDNRSLDIGWDGEAFFLRDGVLRRG
jgi:hypothetical protein